VPSRASDRASGSGNSEPDGRPEVDATASPQTWSVERPFASVVLEKNSAIPHL
jgi:hypothetical protein